MALDPDDPDVAHAIIGKQVQDFLSSKAGQWLTDRIALQMQNAMNALKVCDPHDWKCVQVLQNDIKVVESIGKWLDDASVMGENAMRNLESKS